jgi:serine/threonine protein kinase
MNGPRALGDSLEPSPQLLEILEGYLDELERGRRPNPDELLARHPDLAEPLRGCLASLEFLSANSQAANPKSEIRNPKQIQSTKSQIQNQAERASNIGDSDLGFVSDFGFRASDFSSMGQLGDFRLLREIGRGGMGVVYEAEQISLRRRVALKVLPFAAALDAKQLQRFKNEALAAAGLQHPHIVPVHAVGSDRGVHYYAMQFIEGKSLAEVIAQLRKERGSRQESGVRSQESGQKRPAPLTPDSRPLTPDPGVLAPLRENCDQGSSIGRERLKQPISESTIDYRGRTSETPPDARRSSILDPQTSIHHSPSSIFHPRSLHPSSSFFRTVAQLGIQAADALEHAHRLGIIHRDIKPANLILDNEGKLWVTDFGLAMVQSNVDLTVTGDMVGTLRYMSPEQASAQRGLIDQRTDVYSLGATLYELLALQPVFAESDRHRLLAQIATVDPGSPRRQNPAIPKDLETIVLKALAKSPQERYATAEQLADDLKRFLEDKPIQARRPSIRDRTLKWCKRHKSLLAGSIGLLVLASILCAAFFYDRQRREADAYQQKLRAEIEEQRHLLATFREAKKALDELVLQPTLDRLNKNKDPEVQRENRGLLQKVLIYYQHLADMNSTIPEARYLSAVGYRQVGEIFEALGDLPKGREAYEKSIKTLQALVTESNTNPQYRSGLTESKLALGRLLWEDGQIDQTEQTLQEEIRALERTLADFPENSELRNHLALCRLDLTKQLVFQGNFARAEEILLRNQQALQDLPADPPCQQLEFQKTLAKNHMRLGWLHMNLGRTDKAKQSLGQAREILQKIITVNPDPNCQSDLMNVLLNEGILLRAAGQLQDAKGKHELGMKMAVKLREDLPAYPESDFGLAQQQHELGKTLVSMGRGTEAEPLYEKSIDSLNQLLKVLPRQPSYKVELALCWIDLGLFHEGANKEKNAQEAFEKAATIFDELFRAFPSVQEFQAELACCCYHQARMEEKKADREKACQLLQRAIELQGSVAHKNPSKPEYPFFLSREYWLLAKLLAKQGKPDQANSLLEQAKKECQDLPAVLNDLAWFMVLEPTPPIGDLDIALQMAKQAVDKAPQNGDFWNTLGLVHYRRAEWQPAIAALDKARTFHSHCESYDLFFLAMSHWQGGQKDQARQYHQKALAALSKTGAINEELQRFQQEAVQLLKTPTPPIILP